MLFGCSDEELQELRKNFKLKEGAMQKIVTIEDGQEKTKDLDLTLEEFKTWIDSEEFKTWSGAQQ